MIFIINKKQAANDCYPGCECSAGDAGQPVKPVCLLFCAIQAAARVGSVSWGRGVKYSIRFD